MIKGIKIGCYLILVVLSFLPGLLLADILVVAQKQDQIKPLKQSQVRSLWLGQNSIINGKRVKVIDQFTGSETRTQFYIEVANMSQLELKRYWAKRIFSKGTFPPEMKRNDQEVLKWVRADTNRIGYIDSSAYRPDLDILFKLDVQ